MRFVDNFDAVFMSNYMDDMSAVTPDLTSCRWSSMMLPCTCCIGILSPIGYLAHTHTHTHTHPVRYAASQRRCAYTSCAATALPQISKHLPIVTPLFIVQYSAVPLYMHVGFIMMQLCRFFTAAGQLQLWAC